MYRVLRFAGVLFFMVMFFLTSLLLAVVTFGRESRVRARQKMASFFCGIGLKVIGVHIQQTGVSIDPEKNYFVVSNHLGYLDVLIILARVPTRFVTSMEIKRTAGLGQITDLAACLYVERRSRSNLSCEIGQLTAALNKGFSVAVFPEATSTNGEQVLRFKRPLFQSAIDSKTPVLPLCLNYKYLGRESVSRTNRDNVFWYGDMDFLSHLWRLCEYGSIRVSVTGFEPIDPVGSDPDSLSSKTRDLIRSAFVPIPTADGVELSADASWSPRPVY